MRSFCVSHRGPVFAPGLPFTHVSAAASAQPRQLIVPDDAFGAPLHGAILSEYTQLFGLAEELGRQAGDPGEHIHIFQYRKFLSLRPGGRRSDNMPYAFAVPGSEAAALFPTEDQLAQLEGRLFVGPALQVRSLAANYGELHLAEDFAGFALCLREVDGFDRQRCDRFIHRDLLLPVPSIGVTRIALFRQHMGILRAAWEVFQRDAYRPRTGYQRRVGGFLLERLHSFLLLEEIEDRSRVRFVQGHQIVVSDSPVVAVTV